MWQILFHFITQLSYTSFIKGLRDGLTLQPVSWYKKLQLYCSALINQTDLHYYQIGFVCGVLVLILVIFLAIRIFFKLIQKQKI